MAQTYRVACNIALTIGLFAAPLPAFAQSPMSQSSAAAPMAMPTCTATVAATGVLAPWGAPAPVIAGTTAGAAPLLVPGHAATVALATTPQVTYPLVPAKPGDPADHGGLLALQIDAAGTYRIAIGAPAWIDLVKDGQAVASIAHAHGPACTGIRKMVDFALQPGRYVLQLSATAAPATEVLAVRVP